MKKQAVIGGVIGVTAVTAVASIIGTTVLDSKDYATVVAVEPNLTYVDEPREECRDEWVNEPKPVKDEHQIIGTVAGAVIGGALGNQVGGGSGKDIATAAGAVAGGYAGNKVQEGMQENNTEARLKTVCETKVERREVQDGYVVTYEWNGVQDELVMEHKPGDRIPLEDVRPVRYDDNQGGEQ